MRVLRIFVACGVSDEAADYLVASGHEIKRAQACGTISRELLGEDLAWVCEHATAVALPEEDDHPSVAATSRLARALGILILVMHARLEVRQQPLQPRVGDKLCDVNDPYREGDC